MRRCRAVSFCGLLCTLAATGCWSRLGSHVAGVDNFGVVSDGPHALYRGAQPSQEGIRTLKALGVRTLVNLRDDADPREQAWAAAAGMNYVVIPSTCHEPRAGDLRSFLGLMEGKPTPLLAESAVEFPVFVHCHAGRDRTGLFVAAYRIVEQHWSSDRAIKEMDDFGHMRIFCPRLHPFVQQLDPTTFGPGGTR